MKPTAIVYTSNTGHTRQYALLLGKQVCLPVYSLEEANSHLSGGSPVIYLGWIHASHVSELPDKDQLILVYCRSGNRSKQASEKLVKLGYTNIVEIGGINSWPGETVTGDK